MNYTFVDNPVDQSNFIMFCAISGKPPRVPAISPVSNCLFEKRLLEDYVKENGTDPITNQPLAVDQIITVAQTPSQISLGDNLNSSTLNSNYSIPSLLSSLQNEWDALMLENFSLRKQLDHITKEYSTALYERDAAKLVAARCMEDKSFSLDDIRNIVNSYTEAMKDDATNKKSNSQKMEGLAPVASVANETETDEDHMENIEPKWSAQMIEESKNYVKMTNVPVLPELRIPKDIIDVYESKFQNKKLGEMKQFIGWWYAFHSKRVYRFDEDENTMTLYTDQLDEGRKYEIPKSWLENDKNIPVAFCHTCDEDVIVTISSDNKPRTYNLRKQKLISQSNYDASGVIFMGCHESVMMECVLIVKNNGQVVFMNCYGEDASIINVLPPDPLVVYKYAALHKDGLLLALGYEQTIALIDISKPNLTPKFMNCNQEIPNAGPIKKVFFPRNGYTMMVESGNKIFTFDLRATDRTVMAIKPLTFQKEASLHWDLDHSGEILVVNQSVGITQTLQIFKRNEERGEWIENITQIHDTESSSELKDFVMLQKNECDLELVVLESWKSKE